MILINLLISMKLVTCNKVQLEWMFNNYYAKYLSQHNSNRHYILKYNKNRTFTNHTFENNILLGEGNGIYKIIEKEDQCVLNVQYSTVFSSPNKSSPFYPQNSFYPRLCNYTLGPFYTIIPNQHVIWLPILYSHLQKEKGFKVLNFYKHGF